MVRNRYADQKLTWTKTINGVFDSNPQIDILGLSCYTWNWKVQMQMARRAKAENPNCLVVIGGPHCDYSNDEFFIKYPYIDIIVKQEGETPFPMIVEQYISDNPNYTDIPGIYLPVDNKPHLTAAPVLLKSDGFSVSPWVEQNSDMDVVKEHLMDKGIRYHAAFETNRGCPVQVLIFVIGDK